MQKTCNRKSAEKKIHFLQITPHKLVKIDEVFEELMKMEVLPVQNQFQRQFGVLGSNKVQGKSKNIE